MKGQLSFELQLYIALAGIALLAALTEFARLSPNLAYSVDGYGMTEFMELLNSNILMGNSSFVAYLPEGLCNATAESGYLRTSHGSYASVAGLSIEGSALCPDGGSARLYLDYSGGSVVVSR